jgi:hypothetical protein
MIAKCSTNVIHFQNLKLKGVFYSWLTADQ